MGFGLCDYSGKISDLPSAEMPAMSSALRALGQKQNWNIYNSYKHNTCIVITDNSRTYDKLAVKVTYITSCLICYAEREWGGEREKERESESEREGGREREGEREREREREIEERERGEREHHGHINSV